MPLGRLSQVRQPPRCSFCHKNEDAVRLTASPVDYAPRAYICNECIAVCSRVLDTKPAKPILGGLPGEFLSLVDEWSVREACGGDSSELLKEMKEVIDCLISRQPGER